MSYEDCASSSYEWATVGRKGAKAKNKLEVKSRKIDENQNSEYQQEISRLNESKQNKKINEKEKSQRINDEEKNQRIQEKRAKVKFEKMLAREKKAKIESENKKRSTKVNVISDDIFNQFKSNTLKKFSASKQFNSSTDAGYPTLKNTIALKNFEEKQIKKPVIFKQVKGAIAEINNSLKENENKVPLTVAERIRSSSVRSNNSAHTENFKDNCSTSFESNKVLHSSKSSSKKGKPSCNFQQKENIISPKAKQKVKSKDAIQLNLWDCIEVSKRKVKGKSKEKAAVTKIKPAESQKLEKKGFQRPPDKPKKKKLSRLRKDINAMNKKKVELALKLLERTFENIRINSKEALSYKGNEDVPHSHIKEALSFSSGNLEAVTSPDSNEENFLNSMSIKSGSEFLNSDNKDLFFKENSNSEKLENSNSFFKSPVQSSNLATEFDDLKIFNKNYDRQSQSYKSESLAENRPPNSKKKKCKSKREILLTPASNVVSNLESIDLNLNEDEKSTLSLLIKDAQTMNGGIPGRPGPKTREYCDYVVTDEIKSGIRDFLTLILNFQDRMYKQDPNKAHYKRRYVCGMRECLKHVHKFTCLIIASDLQSGAGCIDEKVYKLLEEASQRNIEVIFGPKRRILGLFCRRKVPVACIGIINAQGAETKLNQLYDLVRTAREEHKKQNPNTADAEENDNVLNESKSILDYSDQNKEDFVNKVVTILKS